MENKPPKPQNNNPYAGMLLNQSNVTLRDYLAGMAMQAFIAKIPAIEVNGRDGCNASSHEDIDAIRTGVAQSAYEQADAMMEARKPK